MKGNFGFRLKYKSRNYLNALIGKFGGNGIYDIKGPKSQKDKNALVIYTAEALSKYLSNSLSEFHEFHSHSGFQESIELLNSLLEQGYTVDYLNLMGTPTIIWEKYTLVIDAGNNLEKAKEVRGQKRLYYATGCHWRIFYANAYTRCDSFYRRHGIWLYPDRQLVPNYSDEVADIITCFGGTYQTNSFELNHHKVKPLAISTSHCAPKGYTKLIASKTKFMWYGGHGPFHKGLDLVVEAFEKLPEFELHIFGNIELNLKLYAWFQQKTKFTNNIVYHGWATPDSEIFQKYIHLCDALVYASSSEGGAGSVIQVMQFGLIPIINKSTAIDLANTTFNILGNTPEEEILSIRENVTKFAAANTEEIQNYSNKLVTEYGEKHSLGMYTKNLKEIISSL